MEEPADRTLEWLIYIIHASDDHAVAGFLKFELERMLPNSRVFVASKAGDIPTGADWLNEIYGKMRSSTTFVLLLTPRSIERHWVWYEAGVAWGRQVRILPIAAAGLDRGEIKYPLGAAQALLLENVDDAKVLFREFSVEHDSPEAFCLRVKHLSLSRPSAGPDAARIRQIQQAFGELGDPPRYVLRRMLDEGGLTFNEVRAELKSSQQTYVSDGASVQKLIDALKSREIIEGDADGRLSIKPELEKTIRECFNPSIRTKMQQLSDELLRWNNGFDGLIDSNGFQRFKGRIETLRDKAKNDYGESHPVLETLLPSSGGRIKEIAGALKEVADRLP